MNAVVDTRADAPPPAGASHIHQTHRFRWLLRREFWEHKGGFFWAPLITGVVFLLFTLIGGGTGQYMFERHGGKIVNIDGHEVPLSEISWGEFLSKASPEDLRQLHDIINGSTLVSATWPVMVFGIVVFFYLLGCLYDERKDRSVLFWKSLPLSDRDTVLSKAASALLVAPTIAILVAIACMFAFMVMLSGFVLLHNGNPVTLLWGPGSPLSNAGLMLSMIPIYALWALPTAGWLLLCSAWSRSKPFLWAILIPVFAGTFISWFDAMNLFQLDSAWFWKNIVARGLLSVFPGTWIDVMNLGAMTGKEVPRHAAILQSTYGVLATPNLWLGAVAGIAMIVGAIRLRRWRDEG